jgi:hypothetical protein
MRRVLIATALTVAAFLTWLAWGGWLYIQRGYSLSVGFAGEPGSIFHVDFPAWRAVVHVALWLAAMAAIAGYVGRRNWASKVAWLTFAATLAVATSDIVEYGMIGTPTSIWTILLLLLFALLTKFGALEPTAEA